MTQSSAQQTKCSRRIVARASKPIIQKDRFGNEPTTEIFAPPAECRRSFEAHAKATRASHLGCAFTFRPAFCRIGPEARIRTFVALFGLAQQPSFLCVLCTGLQTIEGFTLPKGQPHARTENRQGFL